MNVCYLLSGEQFHNLTLRSINDINRLNRTGEEINFIILHHGDLNKRSGHHYIRMPSNLSDMSLMHQRVYIPDIIHDNLGIDRVIFLDSDVYPRTCIGKLWLCDIKDKSIGAVPHAYFDNVYDILAYYNLLKYSEKEDARIKCFNGGVKIINIPRYRELNIITRYFDMVNENDVLKEEPFLNIVLKHDWFQLDTKWNLHPGSTQTWDRDCFIHPYGCKQPGLL